MKICLWGNIAKALKGTTDGGGELQNALLAKALAKAGHEVVIIDVESSEDFITDDGIKVYQIKDYNNGISIFRSITRLRKIFKSLLTQNADAYYCRIRDFRHIIAYWAARKVKAKFILGIASDLDVANFSLRWKHYYSSDLRTPVGLLTGILTEIIYPWLLRNSDNILVQHSGQKIRLLQKKIKSVVFNNLFDFNNLPEITNLSGNDFIYVGSLDKRKGFDKFVELVQSAPSHTFKVVGGPRDKTGTECYQKLKEYKNVKLFGALSHSDTIYQIANSQALISTSPMEGFPNIFIEAWACGIPVLSLYVDPGDIIKTEKLGEVTYGDLEKLLQAMDNNSCSPEFSQRAKNYVIKNHDLNSNRIKEINKLLSIKERISTVI